ncbi:MULTISPECIES: hypothetical protein [Brucella/Ochrobactrum group]|uniref:hypothetical protein n=1 Tax=Brucella/Ochrobactrum group TaxID=2826938 RepID=UPI001123E556
MHRAKYDFRVRSIKRSRAVLRLPSRVLVTLLSFLFLVSAQLCYTMAHDTQSVQVVAESHVNMPHHMEGSSISVEKGKAAPMDHGAKAPNTCIMMTCGFVVQLATNLRASGSSQDFGLPPLVAVLSGKFPNRDLRPPIAIPA